MPEQFLVHLLPGHMPRGQEQSGTGPLQIFPPEKAQSISSQPKAIFYGICTQVHLCGYYVHKIKLLIMYYVHVYRKFYLKKRHHLYV
jgi:hypothetical protein